MTGPSLPPVPPTARSAVPQAILLTSHPRSRGGRFAPVRWGAPGAAERGPIIATLHDAEARNAIGSHAGAYAVYRALAIAAGQLAAGHRPDLTDTKPAEAIGPFPQWEGTEQIVSLDPWGHMTSEVFAEHIAAGRDIRPTIAVTRARINMPEITQAMRAGRLCARRQGADRGRRRARDQDRHRAGLVAARHRRAFRHQHHRSPPRLVRANRRDVSRVGDTIRIARCSCRRSAGCRSICSATRENSAVPETSIACRVHDECNGSDVFGSDICTCRPYLAHGVEVCIATAQQGGVGVVVYNRKEGRALGEVTKFLVYNARKRQAGGDRAEAYFHAHRMRRRRLRHALSGTDAGCAALAGHQRGSIGWCR